MSNFWSGQRRRSNRIKRCEVVGGRYKYIGLKEEDIWLLKRESYEEVKKIIYSRRYLDGRMGCKSVETDRRPVVKRYKYRYGMCW